MRRCFSWLAVPVLALSLLMVHPSPSWAASGGRIGGGSFRSAPSMPRSYGGGGYGGGGGYNGGYRGGYGGGGIGFPFLIPMFGFGGGGLFGFLVLMAVGGCCSMRCEVAAAAAKGQQFPAAGAIWWAAAGPMAPSRSASCRWACSHRPASFKQICVV